MSGGLDSGLRTGRSEVALVRPTKPPWRALLAAALLAVVLGVTLLESLLHQQPAGAGTGTATGQRPHAHRSEGSLALLAVAQGAVSRALGADAAAYRVHEGPVLTAEDPAEHLHASFLRAGVSVSSGSAAVRLSLRAIGYGSKLAPLHGAVPHAVANRVTYAHPRLEEWYANGPLGLEQGFTLARAPAGAAHGPLTLAIALRSSAQPALALDRESITFARAGDPVLSYGGLSASDAHGRRLRGWMQLEGRRALLRVDARGAVYPLRIDPFVQQGAKLIGSEEAGAGLFGVSVALSGDGNTALVGGGSDNGGAGAAWVFTRSGETWIQQGAKLTGAGEAGGGHFGHSVALSSDGNTAVVGGYDDGAGSGAVWVFTRSGSTWIQQGPKLTGSGEVGEGHLGYSVALSADGNTALAGGGSDNGGIGAAWIFTRSGETWTQQGSKLTGAGEIGSGAFGHSVALAPDGNTALVGAYLDHHEGEGAVWAYTRSGSTWSQRGEKIGWAVEKQFGRALALSGDGTTALIADAQLTGRVWVYTWSGSKWTQGARFAGPHDTKCEFGTAVALSYDGNTALIGSPGDHKKVGATWLFKRSGGAWSIQAGGKFKGAGESGAGLFGDSVALSADASTAVVGGPEDNHGAGAAWMFTWSEPPPPEPPEFGRCVTVAEPVTGAYHNAQCTVAELQGSHEWVRDVAKAGFTTKITEGTVTLQTPKNLQVICTSEIGSGEYQSTKAVRNVSFTFGGCESAGQACASAGSGSGEIATTPLEGQLGVTTPGKTALQDKVGLDLFPAGGIGPIMKFSCGATRFVIRGSVILPVLPNKMALSSKLSFAQAGGRQKPERFAEGPTDVLEASINEGAYEVIGLAFKLAQTNEEAVEISSLV